MSITTVSSSDAAYAEWLSQFSSEVIAKASNLPLSTLQVAHLEALSRLLSALVSECEDSKAQWKRDVADRRKLRKEAENYCRTYIRIILEDGSTSDALKEDLNLKKRPRAPRQKRLNTLQGLDRACA